MDREMVIKGLEICEPSKYSRTCSVCPYREEMNCDYVLWHDAIDLLKEQEDLGTELTNAVELIRKKNERIEKLLKEQDAVEPYQHDAVWLCGNCEKEVVGWDDDIDGKEYRYPFCRQCGQAVKWK